MAFDELKGSSFTSVHENADCRLQMEPTVHRDRFLGRVYSCPGTVQFPEQPTFSLRYNCLLVKEQIPDAGKKTIISYLLSSTYDPIPTEQGQIRQMRDSPPTWLITILIQESSLSSRFLRKFRNFLPNLIFATSRHLKAYKLGFPATEMKNGTRIQRMGRIFTDNYDYEIATP